MRLIIEIEKSFPVLEKLFSYDDFFTFAHSDYSKLYEYHFGLGLWVRNNLLVESSPLFLEFTEHKIMTKDDMSDFIIKLFYAYAQEKLRIK